MAATNRTDAAEATQGHSDATADAGVGMAHPTVVPTNFERDEDD